MPVRGPTFLAIDQIRGTLRPFGCRLGEEQLLAIQKYVNLLVWWNQSVSLTSIEDPAEIVSRHFGESIFAASFLPLDSSRLADVGTGAGFPGLALRIACPGITAVLIEPNLRKCAFLNEVKGALNLQKVQIKRTRFEEYRPTEPFDFICSRALGDQRRLLQWAKGSLTRGGRVVLWLGAEDALRIERMKGWIWDLPRKLPESRRRVILSGKLHHE